MEAVEAFFAGLHYEGSIRVAYTILLIAVSSLMWLFLTRRKNYPPGRFAIPILGDALWAYIREGQAHNRRLFAKHGPTFVDTLMGRRVINISRYEDIKKVLAAEHDLVEADWPPSVYRVLGHRAVSTTHGHLHLLLRQRLNSLFTARAVRGYLPHMQTIAEQAVEGWIARGDIKGAHEAKALTFHIMMEVVMGLRLWQEQDSSERLRAAWHDFTAGIFALPFRYPGSPLNKALAARRLFISEIATAITRQRKEVANTTPANTANTNATSPISDTDTQKPAVAPPPAAAGGTSTHTDSTTDTAPKAAALTGFDEAATGRPGGTSALQVLLALRDEQGRPLPDEQLQDLALNLAWAGHDTSATALTRALWLLPRHPAVLARLRAEQQAVVAHHGEAITEAVLRESPYLDAVVKELLRHQVIIGGMPRKALQDFTLGPYHIRKGDRLQLSLAQLMENDPRWAHLPSDSPLAVAKFAPERWLAGPGAEGRTGGWLPFGAGARMCLGYPLALAEIKMVLALLARRATWQVSDPGEAWDEFPLAVPRKRLPIRVEVL